VNAAIVNPAMADGSVHHIKDSVHIQAWRSLGTSRGDEPISFAY